MKTPRIVASIFLLFGALSLYAAGAGSMDNSRKLLEAQRIIEHFYVDSVDGDSIVAEAIRAMVTTLDPHSAYSTPEETREFTEPLDGRFSGIGVQFNLLEDTVYVIQPTNGGPSERVGIMAGDRIVSANDTILSGVGMSRKDIMKHLRGPKGTEVTLGIRRGGEDISFKVIRDEIPIYSVDETFMADPTTGYIRISRFAESTAQEVAEAMQKLYNQGMRNLIIDLSDNGGGYLGSAYDLAGFFLPRGTPVVSTAGRSIPSQSYSTERNGFFLDGRLVVIVNQHSASAAEIFSGAMQDNDRGLLVGRRTFGKGLVQRPFTFDDGSMLRLTVSRYYTPSGRCIQKEYTKGHSEDYQREIYSRLKAGELWSADSIMRADSLRYSTLRNNRPVYGGGGIIPDVFVPADTSYYSTMYRDIIAKNVLNRAVINYVDTNRASLLQHYPDQDAFFFNFEVPEAFFTDLLTRAEAEGIENDQEQWNRSLPLITAIVKGLITRDLYENGSYYRTLALLNPDYLEALRLINDPQRYNDILSGRIDGLRTAALRRSESQQAE